MTGKIFAEPRGDDGEYVPGYAWAVLPAAPSSGVHVCGDSKMSLEPGAGTPCVRRPLSALSP